MYRVFVLSWAKHSQNWISFLLNIEVSTILNKDEAARSQCKLWIWISAQLRSRLKADIRVGLQPFHISFITVFKTKIGLINVDIHFLSLTSCTVSIARKSFCYWKIQPEIKYNVFCYFFAIFRFSFYTLKTNDRQKYEAIFNNSNEFPCYIEVGKSLLYRTHADPFLDLTDTKKIQPHITLRPTSSLKQAKKLLTKMMHTRVRRWDLTSEFDAPLHPPPPSLLVHACSPHRRLVFKS